jgi:hypothetical protein
MVSTQVNDTMLKKLTIDEFRMGLGVILEHKHKPYLIAAVLSPLPSPHWLLASLIWLSGDLLEPVRVPDFV